MSAPMLMTTSAMSARVFIRRPIASDSFQGRPAPRAASAVAPNFEAHETAMTAASASHRRGSDPSEPMSVRRPENTKKIGRKRTETRSPIDCRTASVSSRVERARDPAEEPAEDREDAEGVRDRGGREHDHENGRELARRQPARGRAPHLQPRHAVSRRSPRTRPRGPSRRERHRERGEVRLPVRRPWTRRRRAGSTPARRRSRPR